MPIAQHVPTIEDSLVHVKFEEGPTQFSMHDFDLFLDFGQSDYQHIKDLYAQKSLYNHIANDI